MYQYVHICVFIFISKDIKIFQMFIGVAIVTFGYIQSLFFALKKGCE